MNLGNQIINTQKLEVELLDAQQDDCPVFHRFCNGVYMREVHLKAGLFVLGHHHNHEHLNIMTKGKLLLIGDNGEITQIEAPFTKNTPSGRKAAFILEDTVWINIHATNETDIETIEDIFLDKSADFKLYEQRKFALDYATKEDDRLDFSTLPQDKRMDFVGEVIDMPNDWLGGYSIRKSPIHGKGVFSSHTILKAQAIAPSRINNKPTIISQFINHSNNPNCYFDYIGNGDIFLFSKQNINGCVAGLNGDELTIDYRDFKELLCRQ